MADERKAPAKTAPKKAGGAKILAAPASSTTMADRPLLCAAIERFLKSHSNFESSMVYAAAMKDVGSCTTLNELFLVPLRHKLLSMDNALRFVLFLHTGAAAPLDDVEPDFAPAAKLSTQGAMDAIAACYDIGVQNVVWENVTPDDEDDSEDDEENPDDAESS